MIELWCRFNIDPNLVCLKLVSDLLGVIVFVGVLALDSPVQEANLVSLAAFSAIVNNILQYIPYYSTSLITIHPLLQYIPYYSTSLITVHPLLQYIPYYSTSLITVHPLLQYIPYYNTSRPLLQCIPYYNSSLKSKVDQF